MRAFPLILVVVACAASGCIPKADINRFPVIERLENVVTSEFRSPGILDAFVGDPAKAIVEIVDAGPEQRVGRAKPNVGSDSFKSQVAVLPRKSATRPLSAKGYTEQASAKALCTVSTHKPVVTAQRLVPLLRVDKSARPARIRRQTESIRYSISLTNVGVLRIENISLRDCLPEQVAFKSASGARAERANTDDLSAECWMLDVLAPLKPGDTRVITVDTEYVPNAALP
jgi:uncharacterized repeat protein (TIGR01451 family)